MIEVAKERIFSTYGPLEMVEHIVQIPGAPMNVYSFLLDGVLIDTASTGLRTQFFEFIEHKTVDHVLHTHFHEDHIGNTAEVIQKFGIEAYIHPMSLTKTPTEMRLPRYRQNVWGPPPTPFTSHAYNSTFASKNSVWDIIPTPGHTEDHVALYNRQHGYLFTGDLFVTPKPKIVLVDENILATMASLEKVQKLDFDTMICHHAGVLENGQALIDMKLNYLKELQYRVQKFMNEGLDVFEITKTIFPKQYPIVEHSNSEWSAMHMIRVLMNNG